MSDVQCHVVSVWHGEPLEVCEEVESGEQTETIVDLFVEVIDNFLDALLRYEPRFQPSMWRGR